MPKPIRSGRQKAKDGTTRGVVYYTDAEKEEVLATYVVFGSMQQAAKRHGVSTPTIKKWIDDDPLRMDRIRQANRSVMDKQMIESLRGQNTELLDLRQDLIDKMRKDMGKIPPERLPEALGRLTLALAQSVDKQRLLEDKPTSIAENRSASEIIGDLREIIEGSAEEIPELPSGEA